ncbi:MAG TPA: histidine ammonia-lyase [Methanomassiliicoccales archaeon]|nr:histidine ammonia-lyase [Methanomassiliicoccales archaeon]
MRVQVDGHSLSVSDVVRVAKGEAEAFLTEAALRRVDKSRAALESVVRRKQVAYGVNTGVGELRTTIIPDDQVRALQLNLVRSTACGVGEPLPKEVVRAMMLLRANALASGYSGVRRDLVIALVDTLNADVVPIVPRQGSVGSSGDLAPLAHMALVLVGEGEATHKGRRMRGARALKEAGLQPIELREKEGLALINGTQMMTAIGCLCLQRSSRLLDAAQAAVAMSLEALRGTSRSFDVRIARARPHPGAISVARNLRSLLVDSEILPSHRRDKHEVQDAYTLRCAPQVLGACHDSLASACEVLEREANSATDNPLVFEEGVVLSGGNFHGQPVAMALDQACLAVHVIAAFSERRTARLIDGRLSHLPHFLVDSSGLESGMMILQYTAAALVSENKLLSSPASADSLPTSANQEDYNSMGSIAALKLMQVVENAERVVAIELLCAAQGLEFQKLAPGKGVVAARSIVRSEVPALREDRAMQADVEAVARMIREDKFRVEALIGTRVRSSSAHCA